MRSALILLVFIILQSAGGVVYAGDSPDENLYYFGQFRTGYYGSYDYRGQDNLHESRARLRAGFGYHFSPDFSIQTRFAGRYSTDQDQFRFWLNTHLPTRTGLRYGEATIDIFELRWRVSETLSLQIGRFQSGYRLNTTLAKGLHRYDNPNVLVSWTDGMLLKWKAFDSWNVEYTGEYSSPEGPGSVHRAPLTYSEPASRVSHTLVFTDTERSGAWDQREIGMHIVPSSLPTDEGFEHYAIFTSRVIYKIRQLDWRGAGYFMGFETGYAPTAPATPELHSRKNAFGGQAVLFVKGINEHTNFGVLYGYADPGWLLSPSFRPNSHSYEARYQRIISSALSVEIRYRLRTDPYVPSDMEGRRDGDVYARVTYRF